MYIHANWYACHYCSILELSTQAHAFILPNKPTQDLEGTGNMLPSDVVYTLIAMLLMLEELILSKYTTETITIDISAPYVFVRMQIRKAYRDKSPAISCY